MSQNYDYKTLQEPRNLSYCYQRKELLLREQMCLCNFNYELYEQFLSVSAAKKALNHSNCNVFLRPKQ